MQIESPDISDRFWVDVVLLGQRGASRPHKLGILRPLRVNALRLHMTPHSTTPCCHFMPLDFGRRYNILFTACTNFHAMGHVPRSSRRMRACKTDMRHKFVACSELRAIFHGFLRPEYCGVL
jgi:hypothetical protein